MKNSFGSSVIVTVFGESHGPGVGAVLDGLAPGIPVEPDFIAARLDLRRPWGEFSTSRREADEVQVLSGVFRGRTAGTPLTLFLPNAAQDSRDYEPFRSLARPGHADYTAQLKYRGFQDSRGGGHFSGRVTAALVAVGGIQLGTHIARCAGVPDLPLGDLERDLPALNQKRFAVLDEAAGERMRERIIAAARDGDSVGGILETAVSGLPGGVGEPWFDTLEGLLAHILFSVPGIKGVEFGGGFGMADARGSEYNDPFYMDGSSVRCRGNHNGGVNGGISNGMPLLFRCAVKPTPSILRPQETVDFLRGENAVLELKGRHDPAILHRARAVVDAVAALCLCDALACRYGTDWLGEPFYQSKHETNERKEKTT